MSITKSLLLGSAAVLATVVGAQAADLPSKKAAPATYVKICDAYGAGFFFIPGTDTCVKLGGYVRAEYQYTPGQNMYSINGANTAASNGTAYSVDSIKAGQATAGNAGGMIQQWAGAQDTTGYEVRGRIDVDARTPTSMGVARTFIRLRLTNTSGIRNESPVNGGPFVNLAKNAAVTTATASTSNPGINQILSGSGPTIESAFVQWAGFTFGVAGENYAMMPTFMYHANPYTGFPNGMNQIAYTATLGGGLSATVAIEDMGLQNQAQAVFDRPTNAAAFVGNVRIDQAWGFAAVHGAVGNSSVPSSAATGLATAPTLSSTGVGFSTASSAGAQNQNTKTGYAIGVTASYKLPMIAAGDQVWFTANYADGFIGMVQSSGGLNNVGSTAADHRLIGGVMRVDQNIVWLGGNDVGTTKAWNVAAAYTHYWASTWRSNFTAGYIAVTPPTVKSGTVWWGSGNVWELAGSLIYSPTKDLDIGLEVQYAKMSNKLQNAASIPTQDWVNAGSPGLSANNWSTKLRVERSF